MDNHLSSEDILKAARKERVKGSEYENREGVRSNLVGFLAALVVGTVLFFLEYFIKGTWNLGLVALLMTAAAAQMLYEGIKIKSVWRIILGSIQTLIALLFILGFIGQVIA